MQPIHILDDGTQLKKFGHSRFFPTILDTKLDLTDEKLNINQIHLLYTSKSINKDLLEEYFEKNIISSLFYIHPGVLDVFSYGKTSGVSIDFGFNTTISFVEDGNLKKCIFLEEKNISKSTIFELTKDFLKKEDYKSKMANNIFLCGNNANTEIFNEYSEVFKEYKNKIQYSKNFHTYLGGVILTNINQFKSLFVTKEEFLNEGLNVFRERVGE